MTLNFISIGCNMRTLSKAKLRSTCGAPPFSPAVAATPCFSPTIAAPRPQKAATVRCAIERPQRYSSEDWLRNLSTLFSSTVLYRVKTHILANVLFSAGVVAAYQYEPNNPIFQISPMPHQIMGTLASLLLVFRTNSSYDRFWEARKLWGSLTNRTRSMATATITFLGPESDSPDPQACAAIVRLIVAFVHSLRMHLIGAPWPENALSPRGRSDPMTVCNLLSLRIAKAYSVREVRSGNTMAERSILESALNDFQDILGACERIVKTPVPLSYSRHTSRFLSIWCLSLPFLLVEKDLWLVCVSQAVLSWVIFGTEEIGHLIEDPFEQTQFSLDVDGMAGGIDKQLTSMLSDFGLDDCEDVPISEDEDVVLQRGGVADMTSKSFVMRSFAKKGTQN